MDILVGVGSDFSVNILENNTGRIQVDSVFTSALNAQSAVQRLETIMNK